MSLRGCELIAATLRELGLDASTEGGWVYVKLPDGRELEITCEYGQSLAACILGEPSE